MSSQGSVPSSRSSPRAFKRPLHHRPHSFVLDPSSYHHQLHLPDSIKTDHGSTSWPAFTPSLSSHHHHLHFHHEPRAPWPSPATPSSLYQPASSNNTHNSSKQHHQAPSAHTPLAPFFSTLLRPQHSPDLRSRNTIPARSERKRKEEEKKERKRGRVPRIGSASPNKFSKSSSNRNMIIRPPLLRNKRERIEEKKKEYGDEKKEWRTKGNGGEKANGE